jgi:hypothetical protein
VTQEGIAENQGQLGGVAAGEETGEQLDAIYRELLGSSERFDEEHREGNKYARHRPRSLFREPAIAAACRDRWIIITNDSEKVL